MSDERCSICDGTDCTEERCNWAATGGYSERLQELIRAEYAKWNVRLLEVTKERDELAQRLLSIADVHGGDRKTWSDR